MPLATGEQQEKKKACLPAAVRIAATAVAATATATAAAAQAALVHHILHCSKGREGGLVSPAGYTGALVQDSTEQAAGTAVDTSRQQTAPSAHPRSRGR